MNISEHLSKIHKDIMIADNQFIFVVSFSFGMIFGIFITFFIFN